MKISNLILIILAIGLFYTFSSPVYRDVKMLQASANEYQNLIGNVEHMSETRDALLVNYQNISRLQLERLGRVLPDTVDAVRLALDLDTIGSHYGITIKDVRVETNGNQNSALAVLPDHDLGYQAAIVTFSFVSNYDNFTKMLADLEKSLRIMEVKSINFKAEDSGLYEHTIKVETYWLK